MGSGGGGGRGTLSLGLSRGPSSASIGIDAIGTDRVERRMGNGPPDRDSAETTTSVSEFGCGAGTRNVARPSRTAIALGNTGNPEGILQGGSSGSSRSVPAGGHEQDYRGRDDPGEEPASVVQVSKSHPVPPRRDSHESPSGPDRRFVRLGNRHFDRRGTLVGLNRLRGEFLICTRTPILEDFPAISEARHRIVCDQGFDAFSTTRSMAEKCS